MKTLYNDKQQFIAENFDSCYVFNNGWYKLNKNDKSSLYNSKQELIADNLKDCYVYDNGWGGRPTIGGSPQGIDSILT